MEEHDFVKYPELSNAQMEELQFSSPHPQITEDFWAVVEKVHDGDTITLSTSERDFLFPLRLLDIDAPELSEGGQEAGDWLRDRILGEEVLILMDKRNRVGKYGRLLGKVFSNGMDVGEEMMYLGLVKRFGDDDDEIELVSKLFSTRQWFGTVQ